ncbi:hypothetical protein BaRGS_00004853, partial [Batillaria attramentaria]
SYININLDRETNGGSREWTLPVMRHQKTQTMNSGRFSELQLANELYVTIMEDPNDIVFPRILSVSNRLRKPTPAESASQGHRDHKPKTPPAKLRFNKPKTPGAKRLNTPRTPQAKRRPHKPKTPNAKRRPHEQRLHKPNGEPTSQRTSQAKDPTSQTADSP